MYESGILSIIIPVYNGERFLAETLTNILNSTYHEFEIIAVNDGSTDRSLYILNDFAKKDNRIKVYTKENGGIVSARNYGMEKVTGEFIAFCDQDDIVMPQFYEKIIRKIALDNCDFAMCSIGRKIKDKYSEYEMFNNDVYKDKKIKEMLLFPMLFCGYDVPIEYCDCRRYPFIWNCVFKTEFLKTNSLSFRAYVNYEDDLLLKTEALSRASCVGTISYIGYYWRVNYSSETYAGRYISNIGKKQDLVFKDMLSSLCNCENREDVLAFFKQIWFSRQFLEAVHNLSTSTIEKSKRFIIQYYDDNIYNRDFSCCIKSIDYLKKNGIKARLIFPLIAKKKTLRSYYMEKILSWLNFFSLHSSLLTKLERLTKG